MAYQSKLFYFCLRDYQTADDVTMLMTSEKLFDDPYLVAFEFCLVVSPFLCNNVSSKTKSDCRSASLFDYKNNMVLHYFRN